MGIDFAPIVAALESHALETGLFARVNKAEPKSAPGPGLMCAIWAGSVAPVARRSGLSSVSVLVTANVRIYTNMLADPVEMIDPAVMDATSALMNAYAGDFTLGGLITAVDLLGSVGGTGLNAQAGYLDLDGRKFRIMAIQVPMIIDDVFEQVA